MSLNGLFLSFSALCDFLKKYFFFEKKFKNFFWKKINFPNVSNSCSSNILSLRYGADLRRYRLVTKPNGNTFFNLTNSNNKTILLRIDFTSTQENIIFIFILFQKSIVCRQFLKDFAIRVGVFNKKLFGPFWFVDSKNRHVFLLLITKFTWKCCKIG